MFECVYCKTKFITEKNFTQHKCKEKARTEELKTPRGKMAYKHYTTWLRKRGHPAHAIEIFMGSRYYNVFYTFTDYALKMGIPDTTLYIELMAKDAILPQHWYVDDIYTYFINYLDKDCDAKTHLRISLMTLERLSSAFDCKISEVFSHLKPQDVVTLIQSRNLSPWTVLLSDRFKSYLQNETNYEEQKLIESVINLDRWRIIMDIHKNSIAETRNYLKQLEL